VLPDDDPGWPISKFRVLGLIPGVSLFVRRRSDSSANGLVALRQVFMSFCVALLMFGVVLAVLWPEQSKNSPVPGVAIGLVLAGLIAGLAVRFIERPLDCTDDRRLAAAYRVRFFLRIALAESAALFGFVGFFLASEWWVYPVGMAVASVGFARAAPTRGRLRRDQERLNEQGCFRSLVTALMSVPPEPHR